MFTLIVRYTVKPGYSEAVREILTRMLGPSRAEPGCVEYRVHRSLDDENLYVLYEQYLDQDANEAHMQTSHFKQHILQEAVPLLVSRVRETFGTL